MPIEIDILDVGDGDAIFVTLFRKSERLLIVIDGGDRGHESTVCSKLGKKCAELGKDGPDLVVCTHYDSDHIAGVIAIIKEFGNDIGEIWFHQPSGVLLDEAFKELIEGRDLLSESANNLRSLRLQTADGSQKFEVLLESARQASALEQLIHQYQIPWQEPFALECRKEGWPEIKIIGPTRQFYSEVLSSSTPAELISDAVHYMELSESRRSYIHNFSPCQSLHPNPVTEKTNQVSVIIKIEIDGRAFLFTGDAGVNSLENTIGYPVCITGLHFLKVPHHGSINNITYALIDRMQPQYAYNSGDKYENANVIGCLEAKGCSVRSTRRHRDLFYSC